jgi:5-methylcytosine-specific restriction endonuclease McrA
MAREFAKKFYNSKEWIKCREAFKQSKFGICERCGMPGEEVHHKEHLTPENINDPYITLSFENLELLCSSCHSIEHNRKYKEIVREGLKFDDLGNLVKDKG